MISRYDVHKQAISFYSWNLHKVAHLINFYFTIKERKKLFKIFYCEGKYKRRQRKGFN